MTGNEVGEFDIRLFHNVDSIHNTGKQILLVLVLNRPTSVVLNRRTSAVVRNRFQDCTRSADFPDKFRRMPLLFLHLHLQHIQRFPDAANIFFELGGGVRRSVGRALNILRKLFRKIL